MKKIVFYTLSIIFIVIIVGYTGLYFLLKNDGVIPNQTKAGDITIEKTSLGSNVTNSENKAHNEIFKAVINDAGFHIYYPSYIPSETLLNEKSLFWDTENSEDKVASFSLGDMSNPSSNLPWISIYQNYTTGELKNFVLRKLENLEIKKQVLINKNYGFSGSSGKFNYVIFSTEDGVDIALWSKSYDTDTLIRVAESMK